MFRVRIPAPRQASEHEALVASLYEAGTLGVLEEGGFLEAWFDGESTAARFGIAEPAPGTDFVRQAQDQWHSRLVGERFFLVPPWSPEPTPERRLRIEYRAGMACGTGEHPGTRLAMMLLEAMVRPGDRVLDVGCGSGILGEAARLLGAIIVWGCDIEENDVRLAGEAFVGSARAVRDGAVDLAVANINAETLVLLAADLRRVSQGKVAISGFREESVDRLETAFGAPATVRCELEGWCALGWAQVL